VADYKKVGEVMISYYKIRNGRQYKIRKPSPKVKNKLLDDGYTITKVTEVGNKTKIESISPGKRPMNLAGKLCKR